MCLESTELAKHVMPLHDRQTWSRQHQRIHMENTAKMVKEQLQNRVHKHIQKQFKQEPFFTQC